MLVLSRKKGESILIGDSIEITFLGLEGDVVKLGIQAPKDISILRKEVYLNIREANEQSLQTKIGPGQISDFFKA